MKLSACLIVKNESSCLDKCLSSLHGIDEIVVVDTGSEDDTPDIARKYTDKVIVGEYKWNDNFAEARNFALSKCSGDWILTIDADEKLLSDIKQVRTEAEKGGQAVNVIVKSGDNKHQSPRLFKNCQEVFYKGAIHNYLSVVGDRDSDIVIEYGYSEAHKKDPDRALRILKKEVKANPNCVREKYYLAREYWYRKDYEKALDWYERYLQVGHWAPEVADAHLMAARCLWILQRGNEARRHCLVAIGINPHFREAIQFMAEMSYERGKKRWLEFAQGADDSQVLFVRK